MKLKYYTELICKLVLFSIIVTILISGTANAAIVSETISDYEIFKCQPSNISVSFNDAGVTNVNAILSSVKAVPPMVPGSGRIIPETQSTNITLSLVGGFWVGTFGNDGTLLWGNRSITYRVVNGGVNLYPSSSQIMVYADTCTGTNVVHINTGLNMTYTDNLLYGNTTFFDALLLPYTNTFGNYFLFMIIMVIVILVYIKSSNVLTTTTVGILLIVLTAGQGYIPTEYSRIVIVAIIIGLVYLFYKIIGKRTGQ